MRKKHHIKNGGVTKKKRMTGEIAQDVFGRRGTELLQRREKKFDLQATRNRNQEGGRKDPFCRGNFGSRTVGLRCVEAGKGTIRKSIRSTSRSI